MWRYAPVLIVLVDGKPVSTGFYSRVVTCSTRDEKGQTSDTVSIRLDDARNEIDIPAKDAVIEVQAGYRDGGVVTKGTFKLDKPKIIFGADGEFVDLTGKGADLKKKLKGDGQESFSDKTFGEIVRTIAGRAGMQAYIDPALAQIKFAYKARAHQSEVDFLTRLTDEVGGILKPAGNGKIAIAKRGGTTASGQQLPPIIIRKRDCESGEFEPDGRPRYGRHGVAWIDQKTGKRKTEWADNGGDGPDNILREIAVDQQRAKQAAESEKQRLNNATGSGSVTLPGLMEGSAGADITFIGFRPEWPTSQRCSAVQDDWSKDAGWKTTIEFEAKEDGEK